jgi:hypothetical protein
VSGDLKNLICLSVSAREAKTKQAFTSMMAYSNRRTIYCRLKPTSVHFCAVPRCPICALRPRGAKPEDKEVRQSVTVTLQKEAVHVLTPSGVESSTARHHL